MLLKPHLKNVLLDRIISDHDYGFRSPDEGALSEDPSKSNRSRGRPPGRKAEQPARPIGRAKSKPGARLASLFEDLTTSSKKTEAGILSIRSGTV